MDNYRLLINKLDAFVRKYYVNKLVKGILLLSASALAFYLIASIGEYYLYFPTWLRYIVLFCLLGLGSFAVVAWVLRPLLQIQKLGKIISHEQAARIIGKHFPNVKDKLLNVLQLKQGLHSTLSKELIEASIEQKTKDLTPISFQSAIDLATNKKYLPYVLPPFFITLFILIAAPNIFKESAKRLFSPSERFIPAAPFQFVLENKNLQIAQYDDIEIQVTTVGKSIPESVNIHYNGQEATMIKDSNNHFKYKFVKVSKPYSFYFSASGYTSVTHTLQLLQKPMLKQFKVAIDYPEYTGRKDEVLDNIGDIVAPQGTQLRWAFMAEHTDNMYFVLGNTPINMPKQQNQFLYTYRFMKDTNYSIVIANNQVTHKDSLHYAVSIIPDQYPSINVQQYNDSLTENFVLFVGDAGDDYGISKVSLNYQIQKTNENNEPIGTPKMGSMPVQTPKGNAVNFNMFFDIETLNLQAGDKLTYYFTACDNDAVNGSKCTKSNIFSFEKASAKKLDSLIEKTQEQITKDVNDATKQTDKIDKDIKQMQEKLLQKSELDWQDKKSLENMMERNENLQKQIENIKQKFEKNNQKTQDKEYSDEIKDKQENLEKLLDELKNNELNERMKKMEELMKMLNKDKLMEQLKMMEQDNELMEKDLNRVVEMMKQLERDMRMEDIAKKAQELAKKQDELNKKIENNLLSTEEAKKQQDALNKEMESLQKDIAEMEKVNESMENKMDMSEMKKDEKNAEDNMKNSSSQLSSGNKSGASKSQKNAKKSLEDLAKKMSDAAGGGSADQTEIDIKATRQILQNLIRMSFAQEDLIQDVKKTTIADPKYVSNAQVQYKLKTDSKMIADSLYMLSKRIPKMSSTVNKEIDAVNRNMESAINYLEMRAVPQATSHQQYVMTGVNNLALMLNELLQQLLEQQAQQQSQSSGNGSCNKPGSKPSKKSGKGMGMQLGDIISQQQQLGNAMQQLMQKMAKQGKDGKEGKDGKDGKEGKKPGQQGAGGTGGNGGQQSEQSGGESEQMARIAAQQAALRKQLNDINNELRKEGKTMPNLTKVQQDMDRNETDIVNKRITNDLLRRQSEILSRLLESKEALRQQEQGEQRESNSAKELNREIPAQLKEILKNKQSIIEYYKTIPADLKPQYKKMVEDYYQLIK